MAAVDGAEVDAVSHSLAKQEHRRHTLVAYVLWIPFFFGVSGLHRLYAGRWVSGLIWLFTGGLCGVGQIIDLVFIPRMVEDYNHGRKVW